MTTPQAPQKALLLFKPKHTKYRNEKVTVGGITFDSHAEARRWGDLQLMALAGAITDLQRQVRYELAPAVRMGPEQRQKPAIRLFVDFQYRDAKTGALVLEDTKSDATITDVFRLKAHLLKAVHGLEVRLVK